MECYKKQGKLHRKYAFQILLEILQYFASQPTLVDINVPLGKYKCDVCPSPRAQKIEEKECPTRPCNHLSVIDLYQKFLGKRI